MSALQALREVRLLVPDPRAPGFREEIERQATLLRDADEERDVMSYLDLDRADLEREITSLERSSDQS